MTHPYNEATQRLAALHADIERRKDRGQLTPKPEYTANVIAEAQVYASLALAAALEEIAASIRELKQDFISVEIINSA